MNLLWATLIARITSPIKTKLLNELSTKILNVLTTITGKINWKTKRVLSSEDLDLLREKLKDNYYIFLTMHRGHMSSWALLFIHRYLTGKWGYYAHAFMNAEDTVSNDSDYRFIEATAVGVHYSGFTEVFDTQLSAVALLKPKSMSLEYWTEVMDKSRVYLGRPYDTVFDLANDNALSCVELVRSALMAEPNYAVNFANFERMIVQEKNLDPQMFYECEDFEVVWEKRA